MKNTDLNLDRQGEPTPVFASLRQLGAACLLPCLLAACAAGPDYQRPATPTPAAFGFGQTNSSPSPTAVAWWRNFEDPTLHGLVNRALTNNHDLRIASANLREARALRRLNRLDLLPTVTADGGYARTLSSQARLPGVNRDGREGDLYDAGFDATWELDFFGRVRRSVQASSAELEATEAVRRDVQVSVLSEVARNYLELRGLQHQLDVARRNATNQAETFKITSDRLEGGRGTQLDVARARAQMNSTLAALPPLETSITKAIHRLSVLVGLAPAELKQELSQPAPTPALPQSIAIGNPEELLRRRADIRVAERSLAAVTARKGVAVADLFPRVTFNGRVALEAATLAGLGRSGADAWSFGPRISWAALDLGRVRARIQASDARAEAALANYERAVLTALEETENSLVEFGNERARREYLRETAQASQQAATLARERFDLGAADFLTVLDAERVLLDAQDRLAESETRSATALVAVYKALGGGWEDETAAKPSKP